jgi:hypothetical protein
MVSTRFAAPVLVLASLTSGFVVHGWLAPRRTDPCLHADVLPVTGLIPGSRPEGERRDRLSADLIQWSEGRVVAPGTPRDLRLYFRILRTYNVLKSAERPLALLASSAEPELVRLEPVEAPGGPLPVHLVRTTGAAQFQIAAYLYSYGNDPVWHPFPLQLRSAVQTLLGGQRPLTLFFVGGPANRENVQDREKLAVAWIVAAWNHYRAMCLPPAGREHP